MSKEVLTNPTINKILFTYVDGNGNKRKEIVKVHYLDQKNCFFVGNIGSNFAKPKWRTKADIVVYTSTGTYSTNVIIKDTTYTLSDVYYTIDLPKKWDYKEFRSSSRYRVSIPIIIKFSDDSEIFMELYDLSQGGFSFLGDYTFNTVQSRFPCSCTIAFPENLNSGFENNKLITSAKFVRQQSLQDELGIAIGKIHCFKFIDLGSEDFNKLKEFLEELK